MTREEKAMFCIEHPRESPAFQFYPTDWFGSRHVAGMSSSERGIHATFIFAAWLEPTCGFPRGDEYLTARVSESLQMECMKVLSWCWFLYNDFWFNERLLNERIKQINLSITRREVGSEGGRPKKSKRYKSKPIGNQLDSKAKAKITKSEIGKEIGKEKEIREEIEKENNDHVLRFCSNHLKDRILERRQAKIDDAKLRSWDKEVRLMIERDGRSQQDIISIIDECHNMEPTPSGFSWRDNILSMGTLRQRWNEGKISIGMNSRYKPTLQYGSRTPTNQELADQARRFLDENR